MGNDNAVEFERVSKVYVTEKVVDDVSFQVREGEIFILIGPSGCGKTTTLKMINQLIPHTSGNIYVRGKDVTELDPVELRRSIGKNTAFNPYPRDQIIHPVQCSQ